MLRERPELSTELYATFAEAKRVAEYDRGDLVAQAAAASAIPAEPNIAPAKVSGRLGKRSASCPPTTVPPMLPSANTASGIATSASDRL